MIYALYLSRTLIRPPRNILLARSVAANSHLGAYKCDLSVEVGLSFNAFAQLVLSGDFCQLPPVGDKSSKNPPVFAFDAETWHSCIKRVISLQHVFRQEEQCLSFIVEFCKIMRSLIILI